MSYFLHFPQLTEISSLFCKAKIKENVIFSVIFVIFCNKSIEQDNDKKKKTKKKE